MMPTFVSSSLEEVVAVVPEVVVPEVVAEEAVVVEDNILLTHRIQNNSLIRHSLSAKH